MKTIPLTQGKFALVDDADYEAVSQFKWHALKKRGVFYAARTIRKPDGKRTAQYLHTFLLPGVSEIDHKDGNGLNNQRDTNLRPATHQQNTRGFRRKTVGTSSRFRGVCWDKYASRWLARIRVAGKLIYLGVFKSEVGAAYAYDAGARKYFGEFASPNFP